MKLRPVLLLACALPLACFEDPPQSSTTSNTETGDGDGDPTTTGDGDGDPTTTGDGDGDPATGDGDGDGPPQFDSFTVNASTTPGLVSAASGVMIEAEISDPDMDVNYVVFKRDGVMIATFANDPGPSYAFEWVVSGAEFDGTYEITAEATDQNDNMAVSAPISLSIGMAAGGSEADDWAYDSGELDAAYDITTSPDGDDVVITGQRTTNAVSRQRTDRVVGPMWLDPFEDGSGFGAGVSRRADLGYFVAGAIPKPNNKLDSALYHYDATGTLAGMYSYDASSQPDQSDDIDNPIAVEPAPGGVLMMGAYFPSGGPIVNEWGTYVSRFTDGLDPEWTRYPSEALAGRPFAYDFAAASDGSYMLVGGQFSAMPVKPWIGRFDDQGMNAQELELAEFDGGILHAADLGDDGSFVIGGQVTINGEARSFVRSYDANAQELWSVDVSGASLAVVAAVAVDPWGEVVSVATENCVSANLRYEDCDLVVRKHAPDGQPMWEQSYAGGGFLGPNLLFLGFDAAIDVDRFGYAYVTAIAYDANGTDWWARKLNP